MCGIAGLARFREADQDRVLQAMVGTLQHRGPDDEGRAVFLEDGVALGMRRLSILDIEGGHQPMTDENGRYSVIFNGEIYNYRELWDELAKLGHRFRSDHSDTEVIVHGFEEWGDDLFPRLNGMFAIAIWDSHTRRLILARDRMGEKPLYFGRLREGGWAFGSELKALMIHPEVERIVDMAALEQLLSFGFIVGPRTILVGVSKLPAGHWAVITSSRCEVRRYWSPDFTHKQRSAGELLDELDGLMRQSVRQRMIADVPLGLFLSGGVDSAIVGYYMAEASSSVRSFSIGFDDPKFDESSYARQVADHLGIQNETQIFHESDVLALVPSVTELLDEPMGDQSIFPSYLLCAFARDHVKVAVGGDGSDELFMGYRTFLALKAAWTAADSPVGSSIRAVARLTPARGPDLFRQVVRLARTLDRPPEDRLLMRLGAFHGTARWVLADSIRRETQPAMESALPEFQQAIGDTSDAADRTIAAYLRGYLQEGILVKVDRASMAKSLEVRSPFLDPKIVDFALSIPPGQKLDRLKRKAPLRALMRGRLPGWVLDRPKRGFSAPISAWLRGSLRPLADSYLAYDRIAAGSYFDPAAVATIRARHRAGSDEAGNQLWLLLQFELWRERWLASPSADSP